MLPQGQLAGLVGLGWPGWADLAGGSCLDWLGWLARWLADWASLVAGLAEPAQLAAPAGSGWAGCQWSGCLGMAALGFWARLAGRPGIIDKLSM